MRKSTAMVSILATGMALSAAMVLYAAAISQPVNSVRGRAYVIDGDTIKVQEQDYGNEVKVRLYGIDAPEWDQTCVGGGGQTYRCGAAATHALLAMVLGQEVACQRLDTDRYGRMVAFCVLADGEFDLGEAMVRQGWAIVYTRYGHIDADRIIRYVKAEELARADRVGVWSGTFMVPEVYRHQHQR